MFTGIVEELGRVRSVEKCGEGVRMTVEARVVAEGAREGDSIAVEGISLTVAGLTDEYFEVAIIPKTWAVTNLSALRPGDPVNLEADIIAKYVERILSVGSRQGGQGDAPGVTLEKLAELGFK